MISKADTSILISNPAAGADCGVFADVEKKEKKKSSINK